MRTNAERAADADLACELFVEATGMDGEDMGTVITDLIANLLHLARQEGACPKTVLRLAKMHYRAEVAEEEECNAND